MAAGAGGQRRRGTRRCSSRPAGAGGPGSGSSGRGTRRACRSKVGSADSQRKSVQYARARPDLVWPLVLDGVGERHRLARVIHRRDRHVGDDQVRGHRRDDRADGQQVVGLVDFLDDVVRRVHVGLRGVRVDDDIPPHGRRRQLDAQAGVVRRAGVHHGVVRDRPQRHRGRVLVQAGRRGCRSGRRCRPSPSAGRRPVLGFWTVQETVMLSPPWACDGDMDRADDEVGQRGEDVDLACAL